jgi:hypothetical protein
MKKTFHLVFIVIAILLTSIGCKKGDTGPTGATGNANVQTYTFSVTNSSWVADSAGLQWSTDYTLPSSVNVSGAVLLYVQDSTSWAALPHVDYGVTVEFKYDPSTEIIEVQAADAKAAIMIDNPGPMTFRVVAIPPAMLEAKSTVNLKNYDAVKQTFNLN